MGNHIHIFNTQAEYEANKQNITPPFIAHVKENNKMGMHADKTIGSLFNFQRKNVNITKNGSFTIEPDSSYGALSSVNVKVNIGGASTNSKWTGHADAEGLRAIGWTDEDIAYYQENGVNWNEEDDEYHKVSDDNKALYGVLTASNISTYKDKIIYLPKINTSNVTSMWGMFSDCYSLVSIPQLDTSNVTNMYKMFSGCRSLTTIPILNTSNVTNMSSMFSDCYSLTSIPQLDTSNVTNMYMMFVNCYSLVSIPQLDTSNVTNMRMMFQTCYSLTSISQLNTSNVIDMSNMFYNCNSLTSIPQLDTSNVTSMSSMFYNCNSLTHANLKNVKLAYQLNYSALLSKDSLLYLINNEAATSAVTIKLASYTYDKWATDADVVAALANHPNISIAK